MVIVSRRPKNEDPCSESFKHLPDGVLRSLPLPCTAFKTRTQAGHRWAAAFPAVKGGAGEPAYVDLDKRFVACGDYYPGAAPGRVEGAFLSGQAAAAALLSQETDPAQAAKL